MKTISRLLLLARTIVQRRWLLPTLAVLLGMLFLARLGFWQLDRLEQRRQKNQELRLALQADPLQIAGNHIPDDLVNRKDHAVIVEGEYDFAQQIILKLQNRDGRPGVHLVTPLRIRGSDTAILVDRGWIPESLYTEDNGREFDTPGLVSVNGYIGRSQTLPRPPADSAVPDSPQQEWYRIDIAAIQAQMPYPLLPVYLYEAPPSGSETTLPLRQEREVDLSEGSHLGYAVQWFIFSLMLGIIYLVYVHKHSSPTAV